MQRIQCIETGFNLSSRTTIQEGTTQKPHQCCVAQRYNVHKTCFREYRKDTKVVYLVMWTYDIDIGTQCDYY